MNRLQFLNGHSLGLVIKWVSLQDLKSQIKCRQKTLISKSRNFTKNLRHSEKKKGLSGSPQTRVCSKCGEEKPLDKDHYQVVKSFKHGYSHYCNSCDKPVKKTENNLTSFGVYDRISFDKVL